MAASLTSSAAIGGFALDEEVDLLPAGMVAQVDHAGAGRRLVGAPCGRSGGRCPGGARGGRAVPSATSSRSGRRGELPAAVRV